MFLARLAKGESFGRASISVFGADFAIVFDGKRFSREPLTDDDLAQVRQFLDEYDQDRSVSRPFWSLVRSSKTLAVIIATAASIGIGVAYAVERGLF